jgi:hypothetical protein
MARFRRLSSPILFVPSPGSTERPSLALSNGSYAVSYGSLDLEAWTFEAWKTERYDGLVENAGDGRSFSEKMRKNWRRDICRRVEFKGPFADARLVSDIVREVI